MRQVIEPGDSRIRVAGDGSQACCPDLIDRPAGAHATDPRRKGQRGTRVASMSGARVCNNLPARRAPTRMVEADARHQARA
jgi:hypothetical protein